MPGSGPRLTVDLPIFYWEPTAETLSDALKRITDAIRPIVRTELETIRESYLADHYEPVVRKRDRDRHFEWLARNRVRREPVLSIVRSLEDDYLNSRNVRTVQRGIKRAKSELGISGRMSTPPEEKGEGGIKR